MEQGILVVLTGVNSAAGKDSVMRKLLEVLPGMTRVVTVNTRAKRPGEVEGVDHFFRSKDEFLKMRQDGEFLEWKEFAGNFYGTPKSEIEKVLSGKKLIWRIDPVMALKVPQSLVDFFGEQTGQEILGRTLTIFIDVPSKETLHSRMLKRGASEQEINARLDEVWQERNAVVGSFKNVVVNEDGQLEESVKKVAELINSFSVSLS